jgi:hypothetical protein
MKRMLVVAALAGPMFSGPAMAQMVEHGYVQASGVGTIDAPNVNGEAGVRVTRGLALFVSAGQIDGFESPRLVRPDRFVGAVAKQLSPSVVMSVGASGRYAAAGARYEFGAGRWAVQPYILGSAGLAHLQQRVRFMLSQGHDVTKPVVRFDLLGHDPSGDFTAPMATIGVGASIPLKHLRLDLGYRWSQFMPDGPPVRVGSMTAGVGVRF